MKSVIYIVIILLITACESKINYKKPKDLIPKNQMVDLLYDMHMANATQGIKDKGLEKNKNYMSLIYEKYEIDSTQFASSNTYYIANVSEYEDIFEEVEHRLRILKDLYEKERDSLIEKNLDSNSVKAPLKNLKKFNKDKIQK